VHRLRDPAEFGIAVSGASLTADFLAPQAAATVIEQFQSPGWALDFHHAEVKARICGPLGPDWASMGLMRGWTDASFHGYMAVPGLLVCNPPGEGIEGRIAPGFRCAAVNVPRALWEEGRMLAGVERESFGGVAAHHLEPPVYGAIERRLRAIRALLRTAGITADAPFAAGEARAFMVGLATLAWRLRGTVKPLRDSLRNRMRLARRAEEWMRGHLAEPVQVPDACLALRVSRRELEYAFRTGFDTSPRDFLQALRLNAVRRHLQSESDDRVSISQLAMDHGMTHFGRFAAYYRTLFGESPSETRRATFHDEAGRVSFRSNIPRIPPDQRA